MQLLTIENAAKILEPGEIYRIGYDALNKGEFLYDHESVENFDYSKYNTERLLKLNPDMDLKKHFTLIGKMLFISSKGEEWIPTKNKLYNVDEGYFTKWNGEPLWILDDYETVEEIYNQQLNEALLPKIF